MIESNNAEVSIKRQCELLELARSSVYYEPKQIEKDDAYIMNEIVEIYKQCPFYGYRRLRVALRERGIIINHKRLQALLAAANIRAIYPAKNTTIRNLKHKTYPYLLRGLKIERPNQVWEVDITYIRTNRGFVYLVCIIDVFSRKVMGYCLSTFLDTKPCQEAYREARKHGKPEIVNSDQGCQFTSEDWTTMLAEDGVLISMDGKGRWADNVHIERLWRTIKYEAVYLHSFDTVLQARMVIGEFINFYNQRRPHQSLNYHTPGVIYQLRRIPTKKELFVDFDLKNRIIRKNEVKSILKYR